MSTASKPTIGPFEIAIFTVMFTAGLFVLLLPQLRSNQSGKVTVQEARAAGTTQPAQTPTATSVEQLIQIATATPATPTVHALRTPTPSVEPTPTPRPAGLPPRVGLQVGHLRSNELPDELARLRNNSGAVVGAIRERDINEDIARRVAALLEQEGVVVDVLPATIPPRYDADAFVAIHADGVSGSLARGFKLATPWRTSRASQHLLEALTAEYAAATGLPLDNRITVNMRGYYAFNYRRHRHAIAKTTPAVILEMGYLTNPADLALLMRSPDVVARGIAAGILRYLEERDPSDGAALLPPEFKLQRPANAEGVAIYADPSESAKVLLHAEADARLMPFREQDGWYEVVVRGEWHVIGWVRADQVRAGTEPSPTPSSDS